MGKKGVSPPCQIGVVPSLTLDSVTFIPRSPRSLMSQLMSRLVFFSAAQ